MQEKQFNSQGALLPFLKRLFGYSMQYRKEFYSFIVWAVIVAAMDALFPIVVLQLIDKGITPQMEALKAAKTAGMVFQPDFRIVYQYGAIYIGLALVLVTGIYQFIKYAGYLQERIIARMRQDMFEKLQKLSFSFYDKNASGWLLARISSDTDRVADVVSWGLLDAAWGVSMATFCIIALLWYSWKLAIVIIISIPIMLLASIRLRVLVLKYSRESRKINSEITANYTEHINGVQTIKTSAQEERVSSGFSQLSGRMFHASYRSSYYTAMYFPLVIFIGAIASALILWWGGKMTVSETLGGGLTLGVFYAAFEYGKRIFEPISDITKFYATAQSSLSAGERIFSLLDEKVEIEDAPTATSFGAIRGDILFQNVGFYYHAEQPVLKGLDLHIPAGQSIALVGATGEGKSTIVNLVARFYEPKQGVIQIDGQDYTTKTIDSLRRQMGIVLQTPHLFVGTVKENLRYGKLDAQDADLIESLRLVGAEDFITRMEEEVGEGGSRLSMGERQLLSFARAIVANPRIFIMDEATSSIDTLTEAKIQKGIEEMLKGRTSIVIAHRLSTIKHCDRILLIEQGRISEDGSHAALMRLRGKYFRLYTNQLRDEKTAAFLVNSE